MEEHKTYLGDSVYVSIEGGMIKLATDNGYGASNIVYLEEHIFEALVEFVDSLRKKEKE
jgi:hypothetical protein